MYKSVFFTIVSLLTLVGLLATVAFQVLEMLEYKMF